MRAAQSLLLVGHGSAHDPASGAPVRAAATRLRGTGRFAEVAAAFWKEGPALRDVLESLTSTHVFVVPMFLADGYYARDAVPRSLGLVGPVTRHGARIIHYCPPVGSHPGMVWLVRERALALLATHRIPPAAAELVLAGHGTERSATSADTLRHVARVLRGENLFRAVRLGFLDEAPRIEDAVRAAVSRHLVVVPYFLADGWHTRRTLPERLASAEGRSSRGDRMILYAQAVGTSNRLDAMVLDLVHSMRCCCACCQPMRGLAEAAKGVRTRG